MASTVFMREVQDARALAHKIWLECHNGRSQYHCLAVDVRSLRNVLEDIEEASSSQDTIPVEHTTKLQDGVTSCSSALCILEFSLFALQRSRHSFNFSKGSGVLRSLKPVAVATLRKALLSSTAEAILALEALSAVVPLPLEAADSTSSVAPLAGPPPLTTVQTTNSSTKGMHRVNLLGSSDDSSHTIPTQSLANVDTLKATAEPPSAQPSASVTKTKRPPPIVPPRLTMSPTSTGTVEKAAANPETTASRAIIQVSQPDAVVLTLGLRSPAVITGSSSASKQVIVTLADVLSTKDGLRCISGKKSSSSSTSQIENDETTKHQPTHDKVVPVLHMDPTRVLSDLGAQESVSMPAAPCVSSPEVALKAAQTDNIQVPSAEIPVAPLSRPVQRLKSDALAPTPAAQRSSGIHEISPDSASCQAQPELTTVCLDKAALPTTPRLSAESTCCDRQIPRGSDHGSSLVQPGLEVDERSEQERTSSQLSFRNSEEEVLLIRAPPDCTIGRDGPVSAPTSATSPTSLLSQPTRRPPPPPPIPARPDVVLSLVEKDKSLFDALDALRTSSGEDVLVDHIGERLSRICRCWNNQLWPHAEAYLVEQLESCSTPSDYEAVRRIRHLLGVYASFQGHWQRALVLFLSVLNPGSEEVTDLDPADCAALWWLADTYTLLGREAEAFLAYCRALQGYIFSGSAPNAAVQCLRFEKQCINISRTHFRSQWDAKTDVNKTSATDTIFNTRIFSQALVKACFDSMAPDITQPKPGTGADRSHVNMLHQYDGYKAGSGYATEYRSFQHIALTESMSEADGAWPLKFDPTFCIANVARGRLVERPCDLLEYIGTNPGLDFARPRAGVWAISRRTRFKCDELQWLVGAVRACLDVMNIKWTESADSDTTGLCFTAPPHSLLSSKIATMDFFTISLFRHSLHSKHSVAVCNDGIRSARISARAKQPETAVRLSKKRLLRSLSTDI
nr:hypothetical protein B0A51_11287 [Rachicladosporium sp. CCFEE 5018]OQO21816.1 hypothetical protein B0A51_09836 [Rachicladosporium sp. CCFEE 5018]